jgi:hypothetical protein
LSRGGTDSLSNRSFVDGEPLTKSLLVIEHLAHHPALGDLLHGLGSCGTRRTDGGGYGRPGSELGWPVTTKIARATLLVADLVVLSRGAMLGSLELRNSSPQALQLGMIAHHVFERVLPASSLLPFGVASG